MNEFEEFNVIEFARADNKNKQKMIDNLYDYFYQTLGSHHKAEEAMRRCEESQLAKDKLNATEGKNG